MGDWRKKMLKKHGSSHWKSPETVDENPLLTNPGYSIRNHTNGLQNVMLTSLPEISPSPQYNNPSVIQDYTNSSQFMSPVNGQGDTFKSASLFNKQVHRGPPSSISKNLKGVDKPPVAPPNVVVSKIVAPVIGMDALPLING